MVRRRSAATALVLAVTLACAAGGEAPADRFAGQIHECQDNVARLEGYLSNMLQEAKKPPGFGMLEIELITKQVGKESAAWDAARQAWQKGDRPEAERLMKQARDQSRWHGALESRLSWRWRQGSDAPSEDAYEADSWRPRPAVAALMETRKRYSEAIGRVADGITPDLDPQLQARLEDDVANAALEVAVADLKATWSQQDHSWPMREGVSSPELTVAQQRLDEARRQYEAMFRKIKLEQRELEKMGKQHDPLLRQRDEQADRARRLREQPQGK